VNLNDAIQKHAQWKYKFREAISSKTTMDATAISKDNNCELGKWLHGEAKALHGQRKAYAQCLADHAAFHVEASKVASAVNSGKSDVVEHMLANGSPFFEVSRKVGVALVALQNEIGH